jgi:hypothetical protein
LQQFTREISEEFLSQAIAMGIRLLIFHLIYGKVYYTRADATGLPSVIARSHPARGGGDNEAISRDYHALRARNDCKCLVSPSQDPADMKTLWAGLCQRDFFFFRAL